VLQMIGIIAFSILFILIYMVHRIAKRFSTDFSTDDNPKLRKLLYRIALGFLIFVLVGDEIIGGTQLAYFCLSEPKRQVFVDELEGRTIQGRNTTFIKEYTPLDIEKRITEIFDINSHELVFKRYWYSAKGGWLSRTISFNGSKNPLLFDGNCSNTKKLKQLRLTNKMNYIRTELTAF